MSPSWGLTPIQLKVYSGKASKNEWDEANTYKMLGIPCRYWLFFIYKDQLFPAFNFVKDCINNHEEQTNQSNEEPY